MTVRKKASFDTYIVAYARETPALGSDTVKAALKRASAQALCLLTSRLHDEFVLEVLAPRVAAYLDSLNVFVDCSAQEAVSSGCYACFITLFCGRSNFTTLPLVSANLHVLPVSTKVSVVADVLAHMAHYIAQLVLPGTVQLLARTVI